MNKKWKSFLACILSLVLIVGYMPADTMSAAVTPKLNITKKTILVGESVTLKVNGKLPESKLVWTTGNKGIATVTSKGVVKGIKKGTTTITCKVTAPQKTYILNSTVKVATTSTVTTQARLEKVLKYPKVTTVGLVTSDDTEFVIPEGNYTGKTLIVNAPNADVANYGVFKKISIKAIKASTWVENAKGNSFNITAPEARVIIGEDAFVENITFARTNANIDLQVQGSVSEIQVNNDANIKLNISKTATVKAVELQAPATLEIKGSAEKVPVTVEKTAKGATISSSVPIDAKINADVKLKLEAGAESSKVDKGTGNITINLENKTTGKVEVTTDNKDGKIVEAGKDSNITGTTPGGGGSSSAGSSSGGTTPEAVSITSGEVLYYNATAIYLSGAKAGLTEADFRVTTDEAEDGAFETEHIIHSIEEGDGHDAYRLSLTTPIEKGHYVKISGSGSNLRAGTHIIVQSNQLSATYFGFESDYEIFTYGDAISYTNPIWRKPENSKIEYSSSNVSAAAVNMDTGEVTIQGAGEATITGSIKETETHAAAENSYQVTVNRKILTLSQAGVTYTPGDSSAEAKITITADAKDLQGVVGNDVLTIDTSNATYTLGGESGVVSVTVSGIVLKGDKAKNYTLEMPKGLTVDLGSPLV